MCTHTHTHIFFFRFFFCIFFFRVAPEAFVISQARGCIGATATATAMPDLSASANYTIADAMLNS